MTRDDATPADARLTLKHLRAVRAVAQEGNLNGAATSAGMSRSSLHRQLGHAERILATSLFHRTPSGLRPTTAGTNLIGRAETVLHAVDTLLALGRPSEANVVPAAPHVRVGVVDSPVVPQLVGVLSGNEHVGGVSLCVEESSRHLLALLTDDELDLVVHRQHRAFGRIGLPEVDSRKVADEPLFVAVPPGHRFATYEHVPFVELVEEHCVLFEDGQHPLSLRFRSACTAIGVQPHLTYTGSVAAAQSLSRGLGAIRPTYLTDSAVAGEVIRPVDCAALESTLWLAWRTETEPPTEVDDLLATMRAAHAGAQSALVLPHTDSGASAP